MKKLLMVILFANSGLWSKNKLDNIETTTANKFNQYINDDNIVVYVDYNELLATVIKRLGEEATVEVNTKGKVEYYSSEDSEDLYFYVSYCDLSEEFASCIVTTQSVVKDLESPNDLVDSGGDLKVEKLFNWSRWSKYIQKQKKLYKGLNITEGIDYLNRLGRKLYFNM